ncbi:hypothetical protein P3S67_023242 [Capsicum chacoense]
MGSSCNFLFPLVVFILLHVHASLSTVPNIITDEAALLAFKSHISSSDPNNILATNWSSSSAVCSWIGITCSSRHNRVTALNISSMQLHGTISPQLGNLSFLVSLIISNHAFQGELPEELAHLQRLKLIDFTSNKFTGAIPSFLGLLRDLRILRLSSNRFSGEIPSSLSSLTKLEVLSIRENLLEGEIPRELGDLHYMTGLNLESNHLNGSIPPSIFNITTMRFIALTNNNLTGKLPTTICDHLPNLEGLYLSENILGVIIPPNLAKCKKLKILSLSVNEFTGTVPRELANLTALTVLNLGTNSLSGSISASISNSSKLTQLDLSFNSFTGPIPESLGPDCKLKGVIPDEIGNLTGLIKMSLFNNELTGHIPKTFQAMLNLQELYLQHNKIEGNITDVFCNLKNLGALGLSGNQLSGRVPPCLGKVSTLRYLYLADNMLNSSCNIHRSIKNDLFGKIPSTLEGLDKLIVLSLAHNRLDGPIPHSFGKILALEFLDLSYNNLSGEIPRSLEALVYLKYLNFSFNKLSGEIPTGGPFANATGQSFLSNHGLCGDSKYHVLPCIIKSQKRSKRKKTILVLYVLSGVGLLFLALALTYAFLRLRMKKKNAGQADLSLEGHERISYYELEQATEGFNESNLLGNGSFSKVYKGIRKDGTLLAAKVFNVQFEGAFKSFDTECEMLRNLRHRNLTKVITSCSNLDFRALLLEYMPNGTLDKWLYSHNLFLNLLQRLEIMIDVASAMVYLHNGCSNSVVHCDLKPSNVLLDQEMVGHVSDFGIAKLLGAGETFVQTRTIATIGYIAPEYGQDGIVSTNCDVYSFGIMMMETFTRIRPSDERFTVDLSILRWVSDSLPRGIHKVVDANLVQLGNEPTDAKMQCLLSIMELALNCTLVTPDARISMEDTLSELGKIRLQFVSSRR